MCLTCAGALYGGLVALLLPSVMTAAALGALALVALVLLGDATALWTGSLNMYAGAALCAFLSALCAFAFSRSPAARKLGATPARAFTGALLVALGADAVLTQYEGRAPMLWAALAFAVGGEGAVRATVPNARPPDTTRLPRRTPPDSLD